MSLGREADGRYGLVYDTPEGRVKVFARAVALTAPSYVVADLVKEQAVRGETGAGGGRGEGGQGEEAGAEAGVEAGEEGWLVRIAYADEPNVPGVCTRERWRKSVWHLFRLLCVHGHVPLSCYPLPPGFTAPSTPRLHPDSIRSSSPT